MASLKFREHFVPQKKIYKENFWFKKRCKVTKRFFLAQACAKVMSNAFFDIPKRFFFAFYLLFFCFFWSQTLFFCFFFF